MKLSSLLWVTMLFIVLIDARAAGERQFLRGHLPASATNLVSTGRLAASRRLNLAICLPLRNQAELNELLREIYDPTSARYRQYLTPEQFAEMFGPSKEDYAAVIRFAETNGFTVTATHPNRVVLSISGDVTSVEKAFHLTMQTYAHPREGRAFHAPDREPSLDSKVPILRISGMDDYWIPRPNYRIEPEGYSKSAVPNAGSGPGGSYRGGDFRAAYVPGTPLTGAGQSVGLLQFDAFYPSDIATYVSQAGLPTIPLVVVPINGGVGTPGSGNAEVALDIEMVMSMAPGLSKVYVYEAPNPSPWIDILSRMANDNLAKQLSCSWGGGGPDSASEQIFLQMAAQGQSFFNASGDSDAFTSSIPFPADSPNITQVGGTTLTTTGPGGAYVSEIAWNWGLQNGKYVGTSGGVSTFYALPSYQAGMNMTTNLGSTTMRNVPDVALTGDGIYVVYNNGSSGVFGGTSCAAPLWAGFMALVNQQAVVGSNAPVGFVNPIIYNTGKTNPNYAMLLRDVASGNNFSAASPTRYPAVPGYDLCTGWGTPNGSNFITLLTPLVSRPVLTGAGLAVIGESCLPTNNAIDPGEFVTIAVALQNVGTASTTNLMVTLLATNGVATPGGTQNYGVVIAGGSVVSRSFSFTANGACGDIIAPTFLLEDGSASLGTISVPVTLGAAVAATVSITNATNINIPASGSSGPASIFPSTIAVSGTTGSVSKVTVTLLGLSHPMPDDLDVLLVGPAGQRVLLMSDAGGSGNLSNATLTFDDDATAGLSDSGQLVSGAWRPSNYGAGDTFSPPAPAGPYDSTLSAFNGQNANGNWSLYIQDDRNSNSGNLAQGWSLTISTLWRTCCDVSAPLADLAIGEERSPGSLNVGSNLTFTLMVTNLGPNMASNVFLTNALPSGVTFMAGSTTQGVMSNSGSTVMCALGAMSVGGTATISVTATATTAGTRTNTALVSCETIDPNSVNNSVSATFSVNSFPTISAITNRTINEDTSTGVIGFTISDAETIPPFLSVIRSSSNTNLVPITNIVMSGIASSRTMTITPATNAFGATTITLIVSDGMASATSSFVLTVLPVNDPPVLATIANRTIYELTTLALTNLATDLETNTLTFSLGAGAPTNAIIDPNTGVFIWTPSEAQGPSTNAISIVVTDDGTPSLSATQAFTLVVLETNSVPTLPPIADRTVHAGTLIEFTNVASDVDVPTNTLTFSLDAGAPSGAVVNVASGVFSWLTKDTDAGTTNSISVRATDNGVPSMSTNRTFVATVVGRPVVRAVVSSNSLIALAWNSISGQTYRVQTKLDVDATNWSNLLPDVIADSTNTSKATLPVSPVQGLYRVVVLP